MSDKTEVSPSQMRSIVSFEGFNSHFESLMGMAATYKQAYEMTEALYEKAFGVRKYACWESFKALRWRNMNRKPSAFLSKV
jgi:hypothetical protein